MKLYLALPLVLLALLIAASGVAAVISGWVLPMNRRHVRAPRIYGWGQLMVAFALCRQLVFGLGISDSGARPSGTLIGAAILLAGLIVMMVGQLAGGNRNDGGTPLASSSCRSTASPPRDS
ncbi:hypothetical protein [Streptomyces sp. NPDC020298]|uniref:hypothetical protein n=1 Tax=unclassified Streptomyces TaxID=2593676 RepID=UPI0033F3259A